MQSNTINMTVPANQAEQQSQQQINTHVSSSQQAEAKKQINLIKTELQLLSQLPEQEKLKEKIVEWYTEPPHRVVKLMCYPLLKSLNSFDYATIFSEIEKDLISPDCEIQLNAMKLLFQMNPNQGLEILRNKDKEFQQIFKNPEFHYERLVCLHDFLQKVYMKNSYLDQKDDCINQVIELYLKIAEQVFNSNRDISRDGMEIFVSLFNDYLENCSNFNAIGGYFDGVGKVSNLLRPLIIKITNYFLPKLEQLLSKILSFELRLKSHLISLVVSIIRVIFEQSDEILGYGYDKIKSSLIEEKYIVKGKINLAEYIQKLVQFHLFENILTATYEMDVQQETFLNIFSLLDLANESPSIIPENKKNQLIWELFQFFYQNIQHQPYKKEYNVILLNMLSLSMKTIISHKVIISMKILEIVSKDMESQFNRYLIMTVCFYNLVESSLHLLSLGKKTCLYSLFYQKWFIELKNACNNQSQVSEQVKNDSLQISQEIITALIVSTIYGKIHMKNTKYFNEVLQEVLDISQSIISWKYQQRKNQIINKTILFSIDIFLILLEEAIFILDNEQLNLRLVEVIKLINQNEINLGPKIKAIYVICKNFDIETIVMPLEFIQILADFRNYLIQPSNNCIYTCIIDPENYIHFIGSYLSNVQKIFVCMYLIGRKFNKAGENNLKENIILLVEDLKQHLQQLIKQPQSDKNLVQSVLDYILCFQDYLEEFEFNDIEQLKINHDFLDTYLEDNGEMILDLENKQQNQNQEPRDLLYIAFNFFSQGFIKQSIIFNADSIENNKPITNIKQLYLQLQPENQQNHQYKLEENPVLITGISDFVQIYASHAFFIYKSLLSINLKIFNPNEFSINNLKIKILFTEGVDIFPKNNNPKIVEIQEINNFETKYISFSLNVLSIKSFNISFDVQIQENPLAQIRTIPYKISLMNFILPNYINILSKQVFHYVWNDINNLYSTQCKLNISFLDFWKLIKTKPFSCVILQGLNQQDENIMLSIHNSKNQNQLVIGQSLTVGMLGFTWDGVSIAINISGINTSNNHNNVTVEIKCSNVKLLEIIKQEIEEFLCELSDQVLQQVK